MELKSRRAIAASGLATALGDYPLPGDDGFRKGGSMRPRAGRAAFLDTTYVTFASYDFMLAAL